MKVDMVEAYENPYPMNPKSFKSDMWIKRYKLSQHSYATIILYTNIIQPAISKNSKKYIWIQIS